MMNKFPDRASSSDQPLPPVVLPQWLGETIPTGNRFNLESDNPGYNVQDVVADSGVVNRFKRFLIVGNETVDESMWDLLDAANIPRLPLVKRETDVWVFGVKNGLKPLAHEALFGHQSSETYIGDPEIFYEVGRLYKKTFNATGKLLLNKHDPDDSPLQHIAISSFSEGRGYLFLYPPYVADQYYDRISADQACELLAASIERHFADQVLYQESLRETSQQLIEKAKEGFTES